MNGDGDSSSLSVEQWQYRAYSKSLPGGGTTYTIAPQFSNQGWRIKRVTVYAASDGTAELSGDIVNSTHGGDATIVVVASGCLSLEPDAYTSLESELVVTVNSASPALLLVEYLFKTVPGNAEPSIVKVP
jgi:hypothetical protein